MLSAHAQQFYQEMYNDIVNDDDGVELWDKSKDVLEAYMRKWAQEKAVILHGEDVKQQVKLTVEKGQQQIAFIKEGLSDRFKATALNRLISRIKDVFAKYIVPHLLWRK
ncbi:hypothetical protein UABAM_06100 [Candidatus Uabimicrobium amorphum]|uniref:Uncharacterized protein n=2 Tax=Uabimicrobium amorphum TaxID=2596890 RepID=A0A5S9IT62_UABAM|nr:hypothetical protein UABAM_06100 [Candidatus Uabimicrobium amorphum]